MCEVSKIFVNIFGKLLKTNYFCNEIFLGYEAKCLLQTSEVEKQAVGKAKTTDSGRCKTDRQDLAGKGTRQKRI